MSCHEGGAFQEGEGAPIPEAQRSHTGREEEQKGTRAHWDTPKLPLVSLSPKSRHEEFWTLLPSRPICTLSSQSLGRSVPFCCSLEMWLSFGRFPVFFFFLFGPELELEPPVHQVLLPQVRCRPQRSKQ